MITILIAIDWSPFVSTAVSMGFICHNHIVHHQHPLFTLEEMMRFDFFDHCCAVTVVTSIELVASQVNTFPVRHQTLCTVGVRHFTLKVLARALFSTVVLVVRYSP